MVDLEIPPLRERKGRYPDLVGFYMRFYNQNLGKNIQDITPRAMAVLNGIPLAGQYSRAKTRDLPGDAVLR